MKSNLKEYRKRAGLTIVELAAVSGVNSHTIWVLENEPNPTLKTAYAIAKVLGLKVEEIWPNEIEIVEETIVVRRIKK